MDQPGSSIVRDVEKLAGVFRIWHQADVILAEDPVAVVGNEVVQEIAQKAGD